ncbi:MAG: hypothetical protein V1747_10925 [Candidatus Omnitrophota bacterium]
MKILSVFFLAVLSILLVNYAICADFNTSETNSNLTTIVGKIIDVSCYVENSSKDWENKACVVNVLKVGQPAGILEENTNKLYIISKTPGHAVNLAAELIPYAAEKVRVKGIVNSRGGVNTIDIREIEIVE